MLSDERKFSTKQHSFPNCLTMVPLSAPPFLKQSSNLKPNFQLLTNSASHVVDQLQNSILSSFDKFCSMLQILASKNPVLSGLLSFSSHLQRFSCKIPCRNTLQIPCRNYGSNNIPLNHNFAAILPGDSVAGIVATNGILNFLNIYNTLLVVRLVLTWFPSAPPAIVSPLSTLCDPYLNIFRGIIPPLGGTLDLSPILAFVVLNAFTSAAAALPAELPSTELSQNIPAHQTESCGTTSQRKWMRRLAGGKSKTSCTDN